MHQTTLLPIANCGEMTADLFDSTVTALIRRGNLPQAEIVVRMSVAQFGHSAKAMNFLGWIAAQVGLLDAAVDHFTQAAAAAPGWRLPQLNRELLQRVAAPRGNRVAGGPPRFLLVKAWGYGFWSDVSHIVGQLLLAELTGRVPIIHWGANSRFGDGSAADAFDAYFQPVSGATLADIRDPRLRIWPPKWTQVNLLEGSINQWEGPFSRIAGLQLLAREEEIIVSDFYTSILDLKPWIPRSSALFGLSLDALYSALLHKYLRPKPEIIAAVDEFYEWRLASRPYLAVHARGSDKIRELRDLDAVNQEYRQVIASFRARHGLTRIFLLTDDSRLHGLFNSWYGADLISTDCTRTDTTEGIHYRGSPSGHQLGREVMVDTYLALRAAAFIGNGTSNPSLMVRYLKAWPVDAVKLIGANMYHKYNALLHNR